MRHGCQHQSSRDVLDKLAYGWSPEEMHPQHPDLTLGQINAALWYFLRLERRGSRIYIHSAPLEPGTRDLDSTYIRLRWSRQLSNHPGPHSFGWKVAEDGKASRSGGNGHGAQSAKRWHRSKSHSCCSK